MMKRVMAILLVVAIFAATFPRNAYAQEYEKAQIIMNYVDAFPGDVFDVNVNLEYNPGIVSANLKVSFDERLTLVGAVNGNVFSTLTYIPPKQLETMGQIMSSCQFAWSGFDISDKDIKNGTILTLRFQLSEEAVIGEECNISITSDEGDVIDRDLNAIILNAQSTVNVIDYMSGDVNGDNKINMLDTVMLSRFIVDGCTYDPDGYGVNVNERASDVNDDGRINMLDVVMLSRYIVDGCTYDPDGYAIELKHGTNKCSHNGMESIEAKDATCTEAGNIAYWYCPVCDKFFRDAKGMEEISFEDTVIAAKEHTPVIDPAIPATEEAAGLTEGSHCSMCGKILQAQEEIPRLESAGYNITYHCFDHDSYLQEVGVENPNPSTYRSEEGLELVNLHAEGYRFDGWYDGDGENGELIREILPGTKKNMELYAKWTAVSYKITLDSPHVEVPWAIKTANGESVVMNTVNETFQLQTLDMPGYYFLGWSLDGKIISEVPKGITENIKISANWTSERNKTVPVRKLGSPIIVEDMDNKQLLFTYKIGTIENVPLYQIKDLPNSTGLIWEIETDVTKSIDAKTAVTMTNTVSNATTKTNAWTLSEDWNQVTTVTREEGSENAKTKGHINETGTVTGQQWYVSNSTGGATSRTTSSGSSSSVSGKVTESNSWGLKSSQKDENAGSFTTEHSQELNTSLTEEEKKTFNWNLGANIGGNIGGSTGASVGVTDGIASAGMSAGKSWGIQGGISGGIGGSNEKSVKKTIGASESDKTSATASMARTNEDSRERSGTGGRETSTFNENHCDTSATASSNWNSTKGYETSETVSRNETVSETLSELIYHKYGIGSSDSIGGSDVKTETTGRTDEVENQYASTVEYSTSEIATEKQKLTNTGSGNGYYRVIRAATAHVFAVVSYDIATGSFGTHTYTIVDKSSSRVFIDYSRYSSNFDDCENGILPFEVPFDVYKYVTRVMMRSEGLKINYETGIVERYEGVAQNVVIPEYAAEYNPNTRKYSVTKINGISANAFKGNKTIKGIVLPDYIGKIPAHAFDGCTNLESVICLGVVEIGEGAFRNCTSLQDFGVDKYITSLGRGAFENVNKIYVHASNVGVAEAALESGARKIELDISGMEGSFDNRKVSIGAIDCFTLLSDGETAYSNLQVESYADCTIIGNMIFENNMDTSLVLHSKEVSLNEVSVENAPGFAMILTAETVSLSLYGKSSLKSKGSDAVLAREIHLSELSDGSIGKLDITGNVLICGDQISGEKFLEIGNGAIQYITEEEFERYLNSISIVFDANGGTVENVEKTVSYGQTYGDLPEAVRENYIFDGWYTAVEGGERIDASTTVAALVDQTLYARWIPKQFTLTYDANEGNVSLLSKALTFGDSYGELPVPTRDYYIFEGWYTEPIGGEEVFESTISEKAEDVIIYAHWTEKPILGWAKASQVPVGSQIVEKKWSYTLRTYTSSGSPSLGGWIQYRSERTSWGATQGPVNYDPSNGARNVWSEQYETGRTHHWVYYRWRNPSNDYGSDVQSRSYSQYQEIDLTYALTEPGTQGVNSRGLKYWQGGTYDTYWPLREYDDISYSTRWYFQDPVYTYYFYKDENKESSSYPSGSDISNIQEWVLYREK